MHSRKRSASKIDFWESKLLFSFPIACWFFFVRMLPTPLSKIKKHFAIVCHSFQVCLKFSISFCIPFNTEIYLLAFLMGMNVFIFPLLLQYSCFHYSLHCVHRAVHFYHFYIGDQGLFLFFFFLVLCLVWDEWFRKLQRALLCWKLLCSGLCLDTFWAPGAWMLFTHMQSCLNGLTLNSTMALDILILWLGSLQQRN